MPLTPVDPITSSILSKILQPQAQLQETQAQAGAAGASAGLSSQETVNAQLQQQELAIKLQQAAASKGLRADLQNKMTLPGAISKYTALGMNPNDVFSQYLSESPYGTPDESPEDLQKMGISSDALGKIGTPGAFMDRYNTKNAIIELRGLEDTFNHTSLLSHLPFLGSMDATAKAYNSQKLVVADHLSSLIPGASNSQGSNKDFLNNLPDPTNPTDVNAASGEFSKTEQALLQSKGYSAKDLGLTPRQNNPTTSTSADLLTKLLHGAASDIGGDISNTAGGLMDYLKNPLDLGGQMQKGAQTLAGMGDNLTKILGLKANDSQPLISASGINTSGVNWSKQNLADQWTNHPVNSVLTALPFLEAAKGLSAGAVEGGAGASEAVTEEGAATSANKAQATTPKIPNSLQNILDPQGTKNAGSQIRDIAVQSAQKAGRTISGDNVVSGIKQWADTAMKANPGDEIKIQATVDSVVKQYSGKNIAPADAVKIYNEVDSGYNRTGVQKETIQASRDIALRNIFGDELEHVAPGWKQGTGTIAKGFQAEKSPIRAVAKNVGYGAAYGTGYELLKKIFPWL